MSLPFCPECKRQPDLALVRDDDGVVRICLECDCGGSWEESAGKAVEQWHKLCVEERKCWTYSGPGTGPEEPDPEEGGLLPCPFCGREPSMSSGTVYCGNSACLLTIEVLCDDPAASISAWNKRVK